LMGKQFRLELPAEGLGQMSNKADSMQTPWGDHSGESSGHGRNARAVELAVTSMREDGGLYRTLSPEEIAHSKQLLAEVELEESKIKTFAERLNHLESKVYSIRESLEEETAHQACTPRQLAEAKDAVKEIGEWMEEQSDSATLEDIEKQFSALEAATLHALALIKEFHKRGESLRGADLTKENSRNLLITLPAARPWLKQVGWAAIMLSSGAYFTGAFGMGDVWDYVFQPFLQLRKLF